MRESGDRDAEVGEREREVELIDLARLGAADPERGIAVRGSAEVAAESEEDFEDESEEYDPGWLGTVLRWPVRIVAVVLIAPFQVAWESLKAVGRVAGRGLRKVGSLLGRPFRVVGRAIKWAATRVLWWPLRWVGRGTGKVFVVVGRGFAVFYRAVLTPIGHGIAAGFRLVGAGIRGVGRGLAWFYASALKPIGRGLAAVGRRVRDGFGWVGRQVYRWVLHPVGVGARAVGRVVGRGLYYLAQPIVLLGRGVWHVLKLLGHWIVGLLHVLGEAFDFAARVGGKVGRGVVWLWTHSLWVPIRFVGKGFWDAAKWVGRGLRAVARPVVRSLRAVRTWYRHEITEPVKAALRAARRDIRRALFGRGRG